MSTTLWLQGLAGVVPPLLVAAVVLGLAWRPWERRGESQATPSSARRAAAPLAIGLGYVAGHAAIHRDLPPFSLNLDVKDTLVWTAVASVLVGTALAFRLPGRSLLVAVLSLALPWVLLDFQRAGRWTSGEALLATAAFGCALAGGTLSVEALARRTAGMLEPVSWCLVAAATGGALVYGGSGSLGQLAGCLAAMAGTATLIAWRQPSLRLDRGGALCLWMLHAGLLMAGRFAAELPGSSALVLAFAPHAGWIAGMARSRRRRVAGLGATLVLALAGLGQAWLEAPPPSPYD